ncbi:DUF3575 domain-containing protein [Lacihabitans sp. CS3-21]|uniref:DUF3575 domain-containing protein n=1 Tax=Lacihabitans sp. CS3-21 TaxID=2487332 RepID=UPI0020CE5F56|nr:DUF3575 domain-containing protein [Lacihabitans sp. CS3-21]MCP9747198.1 DUF3575 domain-containing protein [Lacihabitans sp. CS3-21]
MRFFVFFLLLGISLSVFSQQKNAIKFNVAGPLTQTYSLQYERILTKKISFNNTFFYRQKSLIPFGNQVDTLAKRYGVGLTGIKFKYIFMDEAKVGVKGYAPELRFYLGKKKNRPFVALFGQYEDFDMAVPASLSVLYKGLIVDVKTPVNFTFNTLSGGLLIGKQWKWNRMGLDLVVIGPHFGKAKAFYAVAQTELLSKLSEAEKMYLKDKIIERFGLSGQYFALDIAGEKAEIKSVKPVPYLGIRGLGVNLSYSF